jgi:putative addiction module killer protein
MKEIKRSDEFDAWLHKLRDSRARFRIYKRIDRLARGNPGDVEPAGEGVSEMRIHYGPGYRVYFKDTGKKSLYCSAAETSPRNRRILNKP